MNGLQDILSRVLELLVKKYSVISKAASEKEMYGSIYIKSYGVKLHHRFKGLSLYEPIFGYLFLKKPHIYTHETSRPCLLDFVGFYPDFTNGRHLV